MNLLLTENELAPAFKIADIVSINQYYSLHYGWPDPQFNLKKSTEYFALNLDKWWRIICEFQEIISELRREETSIYIMETNADAEINGLNGQAKWIEDTYNLIKSQNKKWLKGITYYQFRDRGGLGLETENPKTPQRPIKNPALDIY